MRWSLSPKADSVPVMGKKISKHQRLKQLLEIDLGRSLLLTAATSLHNLSFHEIHYYALK